MRPTLLNEPDELLAFLPDAVQRQQVYMIVRLPQVVRRSVTVVNGRIEGVTVRVKPWQPPGIASFRSTAANSTTRPGNTRPRRERATEGLLLIALRLAKRRLRRGQARDRHAEGRA